MKSTITFLLMFITAFAAIMSALGMLDALIKTPQDVLLGALNTIIFITCLYVINHLAKRI